VDEDGDKEDAVKVRDGSGGADDSAPQEAHNPVGDVVLVVSNVNQAIYGVATDRDLRAFESTSTIRLSKDGFCRHDFKSTVTAGGRKIATHGLSERRWGS